MVSQTLSPTSTYVQRLKNFIGSSQSFFEHMMHLVNSNSPLAVICHGDCWINNFLYKYDEENRIDETCLVDFQLIRVGSPLLDISNLIYCCTDKQMRHDHMDVFLRTYHSELVLSLKRMGPMPEFCGNEDELWTK